MFRTIRRKKSAKFGIIIAALVTLTILSGLSMLVFAGELNETNVAHEAHDAITDTDNLHSESDILENTQEPRGDAPNIEAEPPSGHFPPWEDSLEGNSEGNLAEDSGTNICADDEGYSSDNQKSSDNDGGGLILGDLGGRFPEDICTCGADYSIGIYCICYDVLDEFPGSCAYICVCEYDCDHMCECAGLAPMLFAPFNAAVSTEQGIRDAVADSVGMGPTTIELTGDIQLTAVSPYIDTTLLIPYGAEIILVGSYRLIGPNTTGITGFPTITVASGGKLTLDGPTITHNLGQPGRGVQVNSGGVFIMDSGSISGNGTRSGMNFTVDGGGVRNDGIFTMNGGTITNNVRTMFNVSSNPANSAGGVENRNGIFTMNAGTISNNAINFHSQGTSPNTFAGGVWNNNEFIMTGGTISDNLSHFSGTMTVSWAAGGGGGVANAAGASFTMSGGNISDNTSSQNGGGGVLNIGTFNFKNGTISRNCGNVTLSDGGSGGVFNVGTFNMSGGNILDNRSASRGGGVTNIGTFTMTAGQISANRAAETGVLENGGGVSTVGAFTMRGGVISGNFAPAGNGGGVSLSRSPGQLGRFTMYGGTISGNSALSGGGVAATGVLSVNQVPNTGTPSTFTMRGGTISGNTAESGGGVAIAFATLTMYDGLITDNTATGTRGNLDGGGGVRVQTGGTLGQRATFIMNGGYITENRSTYRGGGVIVENQGIFTMNGGEITNNRTNISGGGISTRGTTVINDGIISENTAENSGGGIYGTTITLHDAEISENTAYLDGGGIFAARVTMYGGQITDNTAKRSGGGINSSANGDVTINSGVISRNNAAQQGGAIVFGGIGRVAINDGTISHNTAGTQGGAIFLTGSGEIRFNSGTMSHNTAGTNGGAISLTGTGQIRFNSGTMSHNTAGQNGGGIHINNYANLFVESPAIFTNNLAASASPIRNPVNDTVYNNNIHATSWTEPFTQGFNNFDITHTYQAYFMLSYDLDGGTGTAAHNPSFHPAAFPIGTNNVTLASAPMRDNHSFGGWDNSGTTFGATAQFSMPANHVELTALWTPAGNQTGPGGNGTTPPPSGGNGGNGGDGNGDPGNTDPGNGSPDDDQTDNGLPDNGQPGSGQPGTDAPGSGGTPPPPPPTDNSGNGNSGGDGNGSPGATAPVATPTTTITPTIPFTPTPAEPIIIETEPLAEEIFEEPAEPAEIAPVTAAAPEAAQTADPQAASPIVAEDVFIDIPMMPETFFWLDNPEVPLIGNTPLWAPFGELAWSLINLIVAAIGLIIAGIYAIKYFSKKKSERDNKTQDFENASTSGDYVMENTHNVEDISDDETDSKPRKRLSWLTLACIFSGVSAALFVIFQNMNNPMVLIDFWTIAHASLLIGEIMAVRAINKKDKVDEDDIFQAA